MSVYYISDQELAITLSPTAMDFILRQRVLRAHTFRLLYQVDYSCTSTHGWNGVRYVAVALVAVDFVWEVWQG